MNKMLGNSGVRRSSQSMGGIIQTNDQGMEGKYRNQKLVQAAGSNGVGGIGVSFQ